MKKRVLSIILLTALTLTGCGNNNKFDVTVAEDVQDISSVSADTEEIAAETKMTSETTAAETVTEQTETSAETKAEKLQCCTSREYIGTINIASGEAHQMKYTYNKYGLISTVERVERDSQHRDEVHTSDVKYEFSGNYVFITCKFNLMDENADYHYFVYDINEDEMYDYWQPINEDTLESITRTDIREVFNYTSQKNGTISREYDADGRVIKETDDNYWMFSVYCEDDDTLTNTRTTLFEYDENGNCIRKTMTETNGLLGDDFAGTLTVLPREEFGYTESEINYTYDALEFDELLDYADEINQYFIDFPYMSTFQS